MNLATKTVHSIGWTSISQITRFLISFSVTSILAHLLLPSDFGTIAMLAVFINFIGNFYDIGLGAALIQKKDINKDLLSTSFWINLFIGLCFSLILIIASPLIAKFYNNDKMIIIMIPMASTFFIMSFGVVQSSLLMKNLEFKVIALIEILSTFISGLCAIILALIRLGVWSLVGQVIIYSFINSSLLWIFSNWRPKYIFKKIELKILLKYSLNLTGFNIVNYFRRNMDKLLLGRFFGATLLGYYSLSYNLLMFPLNNITYQVNRVLFPSLSQMQGDKKAIGDAYIKANLYIATLTFPLMITLFILAPEFIKVFFGQKWIRAILITQVFALLGIIQSLTSTYGCLYQSIGRTDTLFKWGIVLTTASVASFIIGIRWSIEGVAIAFTISELIFAYPTFAILFKYIDLKVTDFIKQIIKIFLAAATMGLILWGLKKTFEYMHFTDIVVLFSEAIIAVLIYIILIYLLERSLYIELIQYIKSFFRSCNILEH